MGTILGYTGLSTDVNNPTGFTPTVEEPYTVPSMVITGEYSFPKDEGDWGFEVGNFVAKVNTPSYEYMYDGVCEAQGFNDNVAFFSFRFFFEPTQEPSNISIIEIVLDAYKYNANSEQISLLRQMTGTAADPGYYIWHPWDPPNWP